MKDQDQDQDLDQDSDRAPKNDSKKKVLPRWLVMLVVLATGGITAAALSVTGLKGPAIAWDRANKSISGVWAPNGGVPTDPATLQSATLPVAQPIAAQPVAQPPIVAQPVALPGAPVIVWGTPIGHGDRGPCTNCHNVVFPQGTPMPAITSLSSMPHEFRGVCNNCHQIRVGRLGLTPVAGVPMGGNAMPAVMGAVPGAPNMMAARQPNEAEWRGLEVNAAAQAVLVNGVDGVAKRAGIKVGDIITSVNAIPVRTVADFVRATENGQLTQGTVIVKRDGQRLAFEIGPRNANPPNNGVNNNGVNNNGVNNEDNNNRIVNNNNVNNNNDNNNDNNNNNRNRINNERNNDGRGMPMQPMQPMQQMQPMQPMQQMQPMQPMQGGTPAQF
jgi:hypothetical protein